MAWEIAVKDWRETNLPCLQEVQRLGEQRLEETIGSIGRARSQAFTILSILIPIAGGLLAIAANQTDRFAILASIVVIVLVVCMYRLIQVIIPREQSVSGRWPVDVAKASFLDPQHDTSLTENDQFVAFIIGNVEALQEKIERNERLLEEYTTSTKQTLSIITSAWVLAAAVVLAVSVLGLL